MEVILKQLTYLSKKDKTRWENFNEGLRLTPQNIKDLEGVYEKYLHIYFTSKEEVNSLLSEIANCFESMYVFQHHYTFQRLYKSLFKDQSFEFKNKSYFNIEKLRKGFKTYTKNDMLLAKSKLRCLFNDLCCIFKTKLNRI